MPDRFSYDKFSSSPTANSDCNDIEAVLQGTKKKKKPQRMYVARTARTPYAFIFYGQPCVT